jgi:DNA-directed RNA polymerase subunit RPC12/RpoP
MKAWKTAAIVSCICAGILVSPTIMQLVQDSGKQTEEPVVYTCAICGMNFETGSLLDEHVNVVHHVFACTYCAQRFLTDAELQDHVNAVHLIHACTQCDERFLTQAELDIHVQTTHWIIDYTYWQARFVNNHANPLRAYTNYEYSEVGVTMATFQSMSRVHPVPFGVALLGAPLRTCPQGGGYPWGLNRYPTDPYYHITEYNSAQVSAAMGLTAHLVLSPDNEAMLVYSGNGYWLLFEKFYV